MFGKMKEMYDLQKKAKAIQKELKKMTFEEEKKGITVAVNGAMEVMDITIEDQAFETLDGRLMGKVIKELINETIEKAQKKSAKNMQELTGGMFPGM